MKLMRKIITLGMLSLGVLAHADLSEFDGGYVGVGGGYAWQTLHDQYYHRDLTGGNPILNFSGTRDIEQNVGVGQIFAGYGVPFSDLLYGALESSFNFYGASDYFRPLSPPVATPAFLQMRAGQKYGFQFSVVPGIFATASTLVYGRIGYGFENYKSEFNTNVPFYLPQSSSKNSWASEIILGMGVSQYITSQVSLRLEYDYLSSSKIAGPAGVRLVANPAVFLPAAQYSHDFHLDSNTFMASLVYNF